MIVGVTGYLGAGKDTVADYLVSKGFEHISLSDLLREELRIHGKPVTRKNLQELGNALRSRFGPGVLAQRVFSLIDPSKDYVITSIGTVGEVNVLKKLEGFFLVFVTAPQKLRFERVKSRRRENDPLSFAEFKKHDSLESKGGGANYRAIDEVKKLADAVINNNSSLKSLYKKVDAMLKDFKVKRPSWDEYFIGIMHAVADRATCDRGKAAAIIVKNNRILSTGYVGAPAGLPHCDEVGHLLQDVINEDGSVSKHCVRTTHAEQNAIVQAARHGVSIDGSTLYVKMEPCFTCAKMIINAGIKRVVAEYRYHRAQLTREFFKKAGVELVVLNDSVLKYKNMSGSKKVVKNK